MSVFHTSLFYHAHKSRYLIIGLLVQLGYPGKVGIHSLLKNWTIKLGYFQTLFYYQLDYSFKMILQTGRNFTKMYQSEQHSFTHSFYLKFSYFLHFWGWFHLLSDRILNCSHKVHSEIQRLPDSLNHHKNCIGNMFG